MLELFSIRDKGIVQIRELSEEEAKRYEESRRALFAFERAASAGHFVRRTHFEFERELATIQAEARMVGWKVNHASDLPARVNLRLFHFLSAMRFFLDSTEFRLKRTYGSESTEAAQFLRRTNDAFDERFAYRFLYKLRNYAQHCGMPIGHVAVASRMIDPPAPEAEHTLVVSFLTKNLLTDDRAVWGSVGKDIESQPEMLDVAPLVREVAEIIEDFDALVGELERPHLNSAARSIDETMREVFATGAQPMVAEMELKEGQPELTFHPPPDELMRRLGYEGYKRVV